MAGHGDRAMSEAALATAVAELPRPYPTVVHMLADAARLAGERPALECAGARLSYAEYLRCVAGFATELVALGARGERVAIVLGNSIEMALAMFAVHAAGAQAVPINPIYSGRELGQILADAAPLAVIHDAAAAALAPVVDALAIRHRLIVGAATKPLEVWRDDPGAALPQPLPDPDSLASLQYTGGTTGVPKGVDTRHRALAVNVSQREALLPTAPEAERVLCVMPLFHVYALSMGLHLACHCRGTLVIVARYEPAEVLRLISEAGITIFLGGPTLFTGLMAHEGFAGSDFSSLRICYSGSAPLAEETLRRWQEATGCAILEGYGQSEAGPVLSFNPQDGARKPGSVGVALPGTEIEIVDPGSGTRVLGAGEQGEIRARGPQVMAGYRNRPADSAETLREGWLYTGDIGELDDDGYLYIRDRKKDMAIVKGYNVYPREIDEVLHAHPAVLEAAAVGVPDDYRGEAIHAFVVLRPGASASTDELLAHCRRNLARYKLPTEIAIVDSLAKTTVGKIDKRALRSPRAPLSSGG